MADVGIWFGSESESTDWMPNGCRRTPAGLFEIAIKSNFQCNLYVHQAKIRPIIGPNNVCNRKVFATLGWLQGTTNIANDPFAPVWNEVITFNNISLAGALTCFKLNPPKIALDLFDKNLHIGFSTVRPSVKLIKYDADNSFTTNKINIIYEKTAISGERLANAMVDFHENGKNNRLSDVSDTVFPKPLQWTTITKYGHFVGELLVSAELIQVFIFNSVYLSTCT